MGRSTGTTTTAGAVKPSRLVRLLCLLTFLCLARRATITQPVKRTEQSVQSNEVSHCTAKWGKFIPGTVLSETQINTPVQNSAEPSFGAAEEIRSLYIDPPNEFAICTIPKNGCSQWTRLLPSLFSNDTTHPKKKLDYGIGMNSQEKYGGIKAVNEIFKNPNATRVVIIRDPLARLVSAYLDKCFAESCTRLLCLPREIKDIGSPISFRTVLDWMLDPSTDISQIEWHWRPQSFHCGLKDNVHLYTIIGRLSKGTLSRDASCIMKEAGISRFDVETRKDESGATVTVPYWQDLSDMHGNYSQDNEEELLKKLYTPEYARRIVELFKQDFELLHIPTPSWIDDATGEWLDTTDHHTCRGKIWGEHRNKIAKLLKQQS